MAIFSYIVRLRNENKLRRLSDSRPSLTRTEYISKLVNAGFNENHVEVVYDKIKELISLDGFSIYPEDDIREIYGIDDLDDIELIDSICKKLNLRLVEQKDCDKLNENMKSFNAEYILALTKSLAK
jgi:hypothetical protein